MRKTIIAVDFDGTICANKFPHIGEILPHVKQTLKKLCEEDYILILWTCRTDLLLEQAIEFLKDNDIYELFSCINTNYSDLPFKTSCKIYADYYIDDKSISNCWEQVASTLTHIDDTFIVFKEV